MNKTILITGSRGFIGKHLINKLRETSNLNLMEFNTEDGDVADYKFKFDELNHVIHLAGKTYVPLSWKDPYAFYKTNFLGTLNILEICRKYNASLTYISAYVYGIPDYLPIDENHKLKAANPYMHSKIEAESLCRFFAENYNISINIIRPFNVYGPGQSDNFLITKIIKQVLSVNSEISVFSLEPKRDFVYIDDLVNSIMLSLDINHNFEIFNIGSGISYSVKEIIMKCLSITNSDKKIVCENLERKNEIADVVADISKAKKILNWSPKVKFENGLERIIDYERM